MDAVNRFERVRAAIEQLGPADHVCTLYDQRDQEVAIAVSYIRTGLDRGELCVCVVDDGGESILDALASEGIDIDAELRKGRLVIFEKPLAQGLQTRDMLGKIEQYASESRNAGHAGFRIVGEMSWTLDGDLKALAEFEARLNLNRVWERHACTGLCQFDMRRFAPETLREMIILHPLVVVGDRICRNPYYVAPEQYLSPDWPLHEVDWMTRNLEHLQQAQDSLRESQERYRSLSHRLLAQQELERRALARELHDQLGQSLVAVSLNLEVIKGELSPASGTRVRESMEAIEKMVVQVETLAFELRPSMLDDGLAEALRLLVAAHGERARVRTSFTATPADARAPAEIETACFRIAQEALTNVARHARARHVEVTLTVQDDALEMTIRDNGVGFNVERLRMMSPGLIGMRERAELAGGRFDIESALSAGTIVRVCFPLPSLQSVAGPDQ